MGHLQNFTDKIKKFYELVETHEKLLQKSVKESQKPCNSIINQSVLLRAVTPENSTANTGFENLPLFRESLIHLISKSLNVELNILEGLRKKIYLSCETLFKDLKILEALYSTVKAKNLIDKSELNPCSPSFEHIIRWCSDIWRYYHSFYLGIYHALFNLDFENEETIDTLKGAFLEDSELKKQINKIRSLNLYNFNFIN